MIKKKLNPKDVEEINGILANAYESLKKKIEQSNTKELLKKAINESIQSTLINKLLINPEIQRPNSGNPPPSIFILLCRIIKYRRGGKRERY